MFIKYPIIIISSLLLLSSPSITENGIADRSDRYRTPYIIAHLRQISRARRDGAVVIGYLHWSLMDNYEWHEGYRQGGQFGLYGIDRNTGTFDRMVTKGATALNMIIEESLSNNREGMVAETALIRARGKFGTFTDDGSRIISQ